MLQAAGVGELLRRHLVCQLLCLGRHTITGLLRTDGRIHGDWTADYRLYSRGRVDPQVLFDTVRRRAGPRLPADRPMVVALDDTILRKRGRKIPDVNWTRDPLGPPFQTNFVLAQRVLQASLVLPRGATGAALTVPIDFVLAPTAPRPGRNADEAQRQAYKEQQKQRNINVVALQRIESLRQRWEAEGELRPLWVAVDNRLTNRTVLRGLDRRVTLIGRLRADAALCAPPPAGSHPRRLYGPALPTPEQVRQDPTVPWTTVRAWAAGKVHAFQVKVLRPVRWRGLGGREAMLIVIAPLGYRLRARGPVLYRRPAYLICTDAQAPIEQVLQAYLWRWGIEVNFRDEKTLLGVGQAQVRHPRSVQAVPAVAVGAYALLLLAGLEAFGPEGSAPDVPTPAWQKHCPPSPAGTMRLVQQLRWECWHEGTAAVVTPGLTIPDPSAHKPQHALPPLDSAVFCALAG